jgi:hypothetical protein
MDKVYVRETFSTYEFYAQDGVIVIKSVYEKSPEIEDNIIFVERYMNGRDNIIKIREIVDEKVDVEDPNATLEIVGLDQEDFESEIEEGGLYDGE